MTRQRTNPQTLLFLLFGAAVYLYANLFFSPRIPFFLSGDQVMFWTYGQHLLSGARIYQDFFQYTPPGTDLVYFGLFKLFGPYVWVTNAIVLTLGIALTWLSFSLATEIMQQRSALLASVVFLVFIYGKLLNATHHLFSVLLIMTAVKVLMGGPRPARLLGAGVLLGSAAFFTQTHGAFALFACTVWLALLHLQMKAPGAALLKQEALLLLPCAATWFLLSAPILATIGFQQLWHFQVSAVRHSAMVARPGGVLGLPSPLSLRALPKLSQYLAVYILLPVIYPLTLWRCWRQQHDPAFTRARVLLLALVGTSLFVEVLFNVSWLRLFCVASPGIILLFWNAEQGRLLRRPFVAAVWIVCALFGLRQIWLAHVYQHSVLHLPGGTIATGSPTDEQLKWIQSHTTPGQFFYRADWPSFYLPLRLRTPTYYIDADDAVEKLIPDSIPRTIEDLDAKRVQYILWIPRFDSEKYSHLDLALLRDYLHSHYTPVRTFSDGDTIWERDAIPAHN
jgi:hypothetical protein